MLYLCCIHRKKPDGTVEQIQCPKLISDYQLEESPDFQIVGSRRKRRQRACKVCSLLRDERLVRSFNTKYYCKNCSQDDARVYLCNRVRREEFGNTLTCFQIWHQHWKNGSAIPQEIVNRIQLRRAPGQRPREPSDVFV